MSPCFFVREMCDYLFGLILLLISASVGLCENCNSQDNQSKGFVSTFIKYLDQALDFLFQALFGGETKPSTDSEEDDEGAKVSYKGFQLLRIWPRTDEAVEDLRNLGEQPRVQLWLPPMKNMTVDVILPPTIASAVKDELKERDIEYSVLSTDIEKIIASQNTTESSHHKWKNVKDGKLTWTQYHSLDDIFTYLEYLQDTFADLVDVITIGKSANERELKVIRISAGKSKNGSVKPAIWIDGGIHAREWISPAVALFIIRQLVEFNKSYKNLIQDLDWYILPVANPDGYVYSHTTDRLWTKSRSTIDGGSKGRYFWDDQYCKGVDLNRNWDYQWNEDKSNENPCHDNYAGPSPFSEPETRAMSNFILENRDRFIIYLTLHSYSQTWLMPFTATKSKSQDYDDLLYMGRKATESLKKTHGTHYSVSTKHTNTHLLFGNSDDWAKNKAGIKYSYTIKLRDKGTYGYLLPPTQILPTGKEIFTAIRTLTRSVLNNMTKNRW